MKRIKLAQMDCEKVSAEIGDFVIGQVKYTGTTGCVVGLVRRGGFEHHGGADQARL